MTAPALARRRTGRRYIWPPNTPTPELVVPSVTTILGNLNKPALVNWAAKSVAEYAVDNILKWQDLPADDAIDLLKRSPYRTAKGKRDIGTAVHDAIDAWIGKQPTIENLDLLPHIGGAIAFMDDQVERVLHFEATIFNRTYKYAGTTDVIVLLKDSRIALCDWKSGRAIYPEAAIQVCAYSHGEFIGTDQGEEVDLPPIDIGIVVHLPGDGTYKAREVELTPQLWKTFVALRTVQRFKDDFEDDVYGKTHKGAAK